MPINEELIAEERPVATYAQPLSRLQVSWGSILAGSVSLLAVSGIVWSLCLAIILSATHASVGSMKGAMIAAYVCAIATTLIGAFVGGMVAGYLPGNPRRIVGVAHAFVAWAVAFVFSGFLHLALVGSVARTTVEVAASTTSAAVQTAGSAVGGVAGAPAGAAGLEQKATGVLEMLGYSAAEARSMVASARDDLQQILRGQGPKAQQVQTGAAQVAAQARGALDTIIDWTAGYVWLWWATWAVACALAMAGAATVVGRIRRIPERERATGSAPLHVTTLRPLRTTP